MKGIWRLHRVTAPNDTALDVLVERLELAVTFWRRFIGLQGRRELARDSGLLLAPCRSIHTCFLRFPLDVVFLDRHGHVVDMRSQLPPWRATLVVRDAWAVLELPAGVNTLTLGDAVCLEGPVDADQLPRSLERFPLLRSVRSQPKSPNF